METRGNWSVVNHSWNFQPLAAVNDSLDWTDDTCCAASKHLENPVFVECLHDVAHEDRTFYHVDLATASCQFQQALPRDAR